MVLEVELYKLRDQVVQLGDEVGAEVEKLRGQVLEQEEQRKDLEEELEYRCEMNHLNSYEQNS